MSAKKTPKSSNNNSAYVTQVEHALAEAEAARLRTLADYQNLEKRMIAEREAVQRKATASVLENLFPIFDNFYRASSHAPQVGLEDLPNLTEEDYKKIFNYFQGLKMIEKQMEEVLASAGLTRIPTKGLLFDPSLHEAISYEPSTDVPADHIIDEIEAGWQIQGSVIRPAKVRVSQG